MRESGPSIIISVGVALMIWLFGQLIFIPMSEGVYFAGYPVTEIITFIILATMAVLVLRAFYQIHELTDGAAGVIAYEFGKASGEISKETYEHYRTALRGVIYVTAVSLAYLLFSGYLTIIHPALAAVVLMAIVVWSIFSLYRAGIAVSAEIRKSTQKWAESLEKRLKRK
ncbi:MAG: hypothetical protein V1915_01280 [Candidatus Bathyarchaeota archaeon]